MRRVRPRRQRQDQGQGDGRPAGHLHVEINGHSVILNALRIFFLPSEFRDGCSADQLVKLNCKHLINDNSVRSSEHLYVDDLPAIYVQKIKTTNQRRQYCTNATISAPMYNQYNTLILCLLTNQCLFIFNIIAAIC